MDGIDFCVWMKCLLDEIFIKGLERTISRTDHEGLADAVYSTTPVTEKQLRVEIAALREQIQNRTIEVEWISKTLQIADPLTKQGANPELLIRAFSQMTE